MNDVSDLSILARAMVGRDRRPPAPITLPPVRCLGGKPNPLTSDNAEVAEAARRAIAEDGDAKFQSALRRAIGRGAERGDDAVIAEGEAAWTRLSKSRTFEDWRAVGRALMAGRNRAMREAGTNRPWGKQYVC